MPRKDLVHIGGHWKCKCSECKSFRSSYSKAWKVKHGWKPIRTAKTIEQKKEYARNYYHQNKAKMMALSKQAYKKRYEKIKSDPQLLKKFNESSHSWAKKNPEKKKCQKQGMDEEVL